MSRQNPRYRALTTMLAAMLLHGHAQAQTEEQWDWCYGIGVPAPNVQPPELLISGCTAVIQSGNRSGHDLAMAFIIRGLGFARVLQFERAFEDFNESISLDSTYAPAYHHRGNMYLEKGEIERAGQDFDQAARLKQREAELAVEEL